MSHSVMLPIATVSQAMAPAETAPLPEDGVPGTDFMLEEQPGEGPVAAPPVDGVPPGDRPADPLQRLVEGLSGISSALSERTGESVVPGLDDAPPGQADALPLADDMPSEGAGPDLLALPGPDLPGMAGPLQGETGERIAPAQDGGMAGKAVVLDQRSGTPLPGDPAAPAAGNALDRVRGTVTDQPAADRAPDKASPIASPQPTALAKPGKAPDAAAPPIGMPERPDAPAPVMRGPDRATVPERLFVDMRDLDQATVPERLFVDMPARDGDPASLDPLSVQARPVSEGTDLLDPRPGRALPVARQIAEAVVVARGETIEIALAPEELGRLRMVVSGPDQAPHVTIWVERPEVLDQLRRNGAFLQECLGDAGMEGASFEFRGDTPSGSRGDRAEPVPDRRDGIAVILPAQVVPVSWTALAVPARLDIRI